LATDRLRGWLGELAGAVAAHPRITVALSILALILVVMRLITPTVTDVRGAAPGACLDGEGQSASANKAGAMRAVAGAPTSTIVDCAKPHFWEAIGQASVAGDTGATYPAPTIEALAAEACRAPFAAYVGRPLEGSRLSATAYFPTRTEWADRGLRTVACMLIDPTTDAVTGSLRGSNR
jgi:hypothetical protein